MPKRHTAAGVESQPKAAEKDGSLQLWVKLLVSGVIAFHLAAVFLAPMAFATEDSSPLVNRLYSLVRPYATALYLNHGYFFFAPDTGPAHLVDYKVEFADGRPPVSGRFPNLTTERPRLLYHRHFMLSESLYNRFEPAMPLPEPSPPPLTATAEQKLAWQFSRRQYDRELARWKFRQPQFAAMRKSVEEHLKSQYGGSQVQVKLIEHRLLTPIEIERGDLRLDAPETFITLPETPPAPHGSRPMNELLAAIVAWGRAVGRGWDRFWFTPQQPHTLALIRICGGAMLLYTHLVWTLDLEAFFGPRAWLTADTVRLMTQDVDGRNYTWSHLYWIQSPALLWATHLAALIVFALLMVGLWTRVTSVLACVITLSYRHRSTGVWFGLDQINAFIAMYLMVGSAGGVYSLDRWLASRGGAEAKILPRIDTNVAVRLLQVHLCIVYLFGGIGKARGLPWWDGSAMASALTIQEYQSLNLLWMLRYPALLALLTHLTVFWETFYCVLVWPKLTRPVCLLLAVFVHAGIALALGMKTFGLAMIIANLAFVYPEHVRATITWLSRLLPHRLLASNPAEPNTARPQSFVAAR